MKKGVEHSGELADYGNPSYWVSAEMNDRWEIFVLISERKVWDDK